MLNFRPLPYENPEPTGYERANQWGQSLNQLGDTFSQNRRLSMAEAAQAQNTEQSDYANKLARLKMALDEGIDPSQLDAYMNSDRPMAQKRILAPMQPPRPILGANRLQVDPNQMQAEQNAPAAFPMGRKRVWEQEDRDLNRRNTEADIGYKNARSTALGQNGGKPPAGFRWTAEGSLEAIPGGPAYMKAGEKGGAMEAAFNLYTEARRGLLDGLRGTNTGPIMGRLPAITSGQQIASGGVAAMAPVLKQLFRVSGEGVFTDRDQQLLLDMIPTRTTNPDAITTQMENIDRIVKAKLRMTGNQGGQMPAASGGFDSDKEQRYQEWKARQGAR